MLTLRPLLKLLSLFSEIDQNGLQDFGMKELKGLAKPGHVFPDASPKQYLQKDRIVFFAPESKLKVGDLVPPAEKIARATPRRKRENDPQSPVRRAGTYSASM